jgi:magnesium transporter
VEPLVQFDLTKEFLEAFKEAVERRDDLVIRESLESANHVETSQLLEEFDSEESKYVLDLLEKQIGANIINDLDSDDRTRFLKVFEAEEIATYIDYLDSDDAVDILNELPIKVREETIASITNKEKVGHILDLLRYDEDCAGGLMAKELIKANKDWTIVQTIEEIRRQAENVQKIYSVYVVDGNDILLGRVSLKQIILAKDSNRISEIFSDEVISVPTYMDEEEVADIMRKYDLDAVPVINVSGKLLGRITIDDIVDVITEQAEEERQLMSGISEDVEEDDSIWVLTRARLPWLVIGLAGGLIGAQFIGVFEDDLKEITAIAFFIPLIIATGGNVGIQSSALVVQSLASHSPFEENQLKKLIKVLVVALINGILLAGIVFLFILVLNQNDFRLAIVVSSALFTVVLLASFLGTIIPMVLEKMGINPALASGPFITTAIDLLGLAVYFSVVHLLYSQI